MRCQSFLSALVILSLRSADHWLVNAWSNPEFTVKLKNVDRNYSASDLSLLHFPCYSVVHISFIVINTISTMLLLDAILAVYTHELDRY
jgi:energy-converting hydrogenase Eha subunit E